MRHAFLCSTCGALLSRFVCPCEKLNNSIDLLHSSPPFDTVSLAPVRFHSSLIAASRVTSRKSFGIRMREQRKRIASQQQWMNGKRWTMDNGIQLNGALALQWLQWIMHEMMSLKLICEMNITTHL